MARPVGTLLGSAAELIIRRILGQFMRVPDDREQPICAECGYLLAEVAADEPCPECHSTRRGPRVIPFLGGTWTFAELLALMLGPSVLFGAAAGWLVAEPGLLPFGAALDTMWAICVVRCVCVYHAVRASPREGNPSPHAAPIVAAAVCPVVDILFVLMGSGVAAALIR